MRGLLSAAQRLVGAIQNEVIPQEPRVPVDRGVYRAGWKARPNEHGAEIGNETPHAVFIEDGVRGDHVKPGREMILALTQWIKRKGIVGTAAPDGSTLDATQLAWAIARSMQKRGIFNRGVGLKIMDKAVRRYARRFIEEEVKRELERGARKGGE